MSQAPRNPFESGNDQFGQPAKPQSNNTWLWVLGIIGGIFLLSVVACCGISLYMWSSASGMIAEAVVEEFADDPVVVDKIGTISESSMDFGEAVSESSKDEDISAMVFDVKGDKGSGKIIHRTHMQTGEITVELVLDGGETFELEQEDELDDLEMDFEALEESEELEMLEESADDSAEASLELSAEPESL